MSVRIVGGDRARLSVRVVERRNGRGSIGDAVCIIYGGGGIFDGETGYYEMSKTSNSDPISWHRARYRGVQRLGSGVPSPISGGAFVELMRYIEELESRMSKLEEVSEMVIEMVESGETFDFYTITEIYQKCKE